MPDISAVNQAEGCTDGQMIYVPAEGGMTEIRAAESGPKVILTTG